MKLLIFKLSKVEELFFDKLDSKLFGLNQFIDGDFVFSDTVKVLDDQADLFDNLWEFGDFGHSLMQY